MSALLDSLLTPQQLAQCAAAEAIYADHELTAAEFGDEPIRERLVNLRGAEIEARYVVTDRGVEIVELELQPGCWVDPDVLLLPAVIAELARQIAAEDAQDAEDAAEIEDLRRWARLAA